MALGDLFEGDKKKTYIYIGIALVGVVIAYLTYKKMSGGGAASPTSAVVPVAAPSGYSGGGFANGAGSFLSASSPTSGGTGSNQPPQVGALSGSGFLPPGVSASAIPSNPGTYQATDIYGNQYTWLNPAQFQGYQGQAYYEPQPGVFQPYNPGQNLAPNTPIYGRVA